ncbi:MAG: hypothetical protein WAN11_20205, partial [Syntrophobacteraceae bacterium]
FFVQKWLPYAVQHRSFQTGNLAGDPPNLLERKVPGGLLHSAVLHAGTTSKVAAIRNLNI